jgi:hypothetical protein
MGKDEELGCDLMTVVLLIISFTAGATVCHIKWRDWNVQRAVESGEAHYDTKTGDLVWEKKQ